MVWQETRTIAIVITLDATVQEEYFPCDPDIPTAYVDNESGDQFTAIVSDRAVHSGEPQEVLSTMKLSVDRKSKFHLRPNESQANEEQSAVRSKELLHYHFTAWSALSLPEDDDREALIRFSGASRGAEEDRDGSPRIVHDFMYANRTGTFIALDFLLGEIEDGALEDSDTQADVIFDTVDSLNKQRPYMVYSPKLFEFLYETLKEDLTQKLAFDAKKSFSALWSKVLLSASATRFDYDNSMFRIHGTSMDGIDRFVSRSMSDLCDLHTRLTLKFPNEEYGSRTSPWFQDLLRAFQQRRKRLDLHFYANRYIQELVSSPQRVFTSTEYLEFFAPWQHDLTTLRSEVPGEESMERNKNKEVDELDRAKMRAVLLDAGISETSIQKFMEKGHRSKDDTGPVGIDTNKPTYIKVHRKHMSPDTLDSYDLPWEWDPVSYTNLESMMATADDM